MRLVRHLQQHRSWLIAALVVTALSLLVAFAPPLQAASPQASDPAALEQSQIFNDDLRVRSGQTIDGDVVVYQGDVTVENEGAIRGNLIVYSGEVEIEHGGVVDGDITSFAGDVKIAGMVNGSVSAFSGDIELEEGAVVDGDISAVSGDIKQDAGAAVGGSVLRGPNLKLQLPPMPAMPGIPGAAIVSSPLPQPPSFAERFLGFVWRVLRALLLLALAAGIGVGLLVWRPQWVEETRLLLVERTALSFAAGLLFNLFGLAVIGLLWVTVCFRPPGALLGLLLAAINLAGLAIAGNQSGRWLEQRSGATWLQPWRTVIGIVTPGALIAVLWILGSCFGFFAFVGALVLTSFGTGAILVKILKLGEPNAPAGAVLASPPPPDAAAKTPVSDPLNEAVTPFDPEAMTAAPAPDDSQAVDAAIIADASSVAPGDTKGRAPATSPSAESLPLAVVDFTQIAGIGPVFDQRLREAGVRSFAELAAHTPAEIAAIINWSEERVERSNIIEQAVKLAQGEA